MSIDKKLEMEPDEDIKRVSFSETVEKVLEESEAAAQLFLLGCIQTGIDTNPRPL